MWPRGGAKRIGRHQDRAERGVHRGGYQWRHGGFGARAGESRHGFNSWARGGDGVSCASRLYWWEQVRTKDGLYWWEQVRTKDGLYWCCSSNKWEQVFLSFVAGHIKMHMEWYNWEQVNQWHRYGIIVNNLKSQIGLHHYDGSSRWLKWIYHLHTSELGWERYAQDIMWTRWDPHQATWRHASTQEPCVHDT
jgi:hypothetical protein